MNTGRSFFLVVVLLVSIPSQSSVIAQQLPDDNRWSDLFGGDIEFNGTIWKAVPSGDNIYVLGDFTRVGGMLTDGWAMWDGTSWSPMVGGPCQLEDVLRTQSFCRFNFQHFGVAGDRVYAGAEMWNKADSTTTQALLEWDGETWTVRYEFAGLRDFVMAVAVDGDPTQNEEVIYLSGKFISQGSDPTGRAATGIMRLEGDTETRMGVVDCVLGVLRSCAYLLEYDAGHLYVSGEFDMVDGVPAERIARWNGSQWEGIGLEITPGTGLQEIRDMYARDGEVYLAGQLSEINGEQTPLGAIKWDGTDWQLFGSSFTEGEILGSGSRIASVGSELFISGSFFSVREAVERSESGVVSMISWDETSPTLESVKGLLRQGIVDLAEYNGKLLIAEEQRISLYQAGSLMPLDNPNQGLNGPVVELTSDNDYLYAAGDFTAAGGLQSHFVARWDGQSWLGYGDALNGQVKNMEVVDGVVYAAPPLRSHPYLTKVHGEPVTPLAMLKDNVWQPFPYRIRGNENDTEGTATIWNLRQLNNTLFVLGVFTLIDDMEVSSGIAQWDGTNWTTYPSAYSLSLNVWDVAVMNDTLYAGGNFSGGDNAPGDAVVKWNGTEWEAVGNDNFPDAFVQELLVDEETLYAFSNRGMYRLENGDWVEEASASMSWGLNFMKGGVAKDDSTIYVGGVLSLDEPVVINETCQFNTIYVGRYKAGEISPLGSSTYRCRLQDFYAWDWGILDWVNDVELFDGHLYVGGDFTYAGGKPANYLSSYNLAASITSVAEEHPTGSFELQTPYPNPFNQTLNLSYVLPQAQHVRIDVHDLLGRRVAQLVDTYKQAGQHTMQWRPDSLPAGIYFMALQTNQERVVQKVVYVR